LKVVFKYFLVFIFFLPIFTLTSVAVKYDINLRTNIALIIYSFQLLSFLFLFLFYDVKFNFTSKKTLKILVLFFGSVLWLWIFTQTNISYVFKIGLNIMIGYFGYRIFIKHKNICLRVLKTILLLNVIAVLVESIWYSLFQQNLQIHNFLFPFSRENSVDIYSGFFRACGLQYEPGNYSIIISIIVLLIHNYDDKSKNLSLFLLAIISIIITKSLVGILLAIILLIFIFFRKSSFSINFVIRFSLLFLVFSGSVLAYVFFRLDNIDSFRSLAQKVYLFDVWTQKDFYSILTGNGIERFENISYDRNLGFAKDLGLVFNLLYTFGVYGLLIVFWIIKKIKTDSFFQKFLLLLIIFFSKLGPLFPIFFLFIFSFILIEKNNLIALK
jgi:hypothetical protein